ncbi:MAG: prenyltransferase/squalene oxidase repeat-containing protein [Acidobacteriota bacterium]
MTWQEPFSTELARLQSRELPEGGFPSRPDSILFRPDCTAWATLALSAAGVPSKSLRPSRWRLAEEQGEDGRVSLSRDHPEAFWPTSLAILAWQGAVGYREPRSRALHFLLQTTGIQFKNSSTSPLGHDESIPGWPWIGGTHSWVEPTAMALLALAVTGYGGHSRAEEATRLLLDRQLPTGGWNYGNTLVFGNELLPLPEVTGVVLSALAGRVAPDRVEASLKYLRSALEEMRSPLTLGWGLLGLNAWKRRPREALDWIRQSQGQQDKYGPYDTTSISLLLLAGLGKEGLLSLIEPSRLSK